MFELFVALKYLIPRRAHLSVSLIAFLSVVVISLIVWLMLVFLSVTEGIERNWLHKLTILNAPIRITPTAEYYNSYYHQIDALAAASEYTPKTLAKKLNATQSDPYNKQLDETLPVHFPQRDLDEAGQLKDPVKGLAKILEGMQGIRSQDFELSGALMRLQLLNEETHTQGYLTQVSYLSTVPDGSGKFDTLKIPPSEKDLNHLLYLAQHATESSRQDAPTLTSKTTENLAHQRVCSILKTVRLEQLKPRYALWQLPLLLLPEHVRFSAQVHLRHERIHRIDLPAAPNDETAYIYREGERLFLEREGKREILSTVPLLVSGDLLLDVKSQQGAVIEVQTSLQHHTLQGQVALEGLEVVKATFLAAPQFEEKEVGVWLAKSFIDGGVLLGDRGYLSYSSTTSGSLQEHRIPLFVEGFYDPGVLSVGNKCILVPPCVTQAINASTSSFNLDKTQSNGFLVWFDALDNTPALKEEIIRALQARGLDRYWKVSGYYEYDFAKDLLEQFQSDKYLFMLVGVLILIVGCCNIISLLVLLVSDKKQEIGILQAMGASKLSIAAIFGLCGVAMGLLSCVIGTLAAALTMKYIDALVYLLSLLQGHAAFNPTFFGKTLPHELTANALVFILIATPLLSLVAGLIPAIKTCRLNPSKLLRS